MGDKFGSLPEVGGIPVTSEWFPTRMQAFIFRAWEFVPASKIAGVLGTTEDNVLKQAEKMGLYKQYLTDNWLKRGYITIIKSFWHLLPYEQMLELLDWDAERFSKALTEEDFLRYKLSPDDKKPYCEPIFYAELTPEQEQKTELIRRAVSRIGSMEYKKEPFDWFGKAQTDEHVSAEWTLCDKTGFENTVFFSERFAFYIKEKCGFGVDISGKDCGKTILLLCDAELSRPEEYRISLRGQNIVLSAGSEDGILRALYALEDEFCRRGSGLEGFKTVHKYAKVRNRYIYPYCGLYNNSFDVDSSFHCPDELLEQYARVGINGLWFHVPMYQLAEFPFCPELSDGYEKRLERLNELTVRAARFGIRIYIYINEPRAMPHSFFEKFPELKGSETPNRACLCTSTEAVKRYISDGIYSITRSVPLLGGYFIIGVSENQSNCFWDKKGSACPRCSKRNPRDVVTEVYNIISRAAHMAKPGIEVIGWTWSWGLDSFPYGYRNDADDSDVEDLIRRLDKDIVVMCCKEEIQEFEVDGYKNQVHDYAMSIEGPSEMAKRVWRAARKNGARVGAKTQINCTWECSTVPYLPVFDIVQRDINNILAEGIDTMMLSWSLGGYPSPNIELASEFFFCNADGSGICVDEFYSRKFGEYAPVIKEAARLFSEGFREFPFDWRTLYYGPQNMGVSNPLYLKPTGREATMTCYAFDDISRWNTEFPFGVFKNRFRRMSEKWEQGIKLLEDIPDCEFKDVAYVGYTLFKSGFNQISFIEQRDEKCGNLIDIVRDERQMALRVYEIMSRNPAIGYEAANHYYFSRGLVAEKLINCEYIEAELGL